MKRLEMIDYGSINRVVRFAETPTPAIGDNDLLVKVAAASINPIDFKLIRGDLRKIQKLTFPVALGFDACGTVVAVGTKVSRFKQGDRVYTRAPRQRMGAFAEYMAIAEEHTAMAPASLSAMEAASIPLVGLTTVQALIDRARARPGQSILIHAGSGGLGSFAIQYARNVLDLKVSATTSSKNADWVRELGADKVYPYDIDDYRQTPTRYDIVFDTLGGNTTKDSFEVLKPGGTVVSVAGPPDRQFAKQVDTGPILAAVMWCMSLPVYSKAKKKRAAYFRFLTESNGGQLDVIKDVLESGKVKPVIDHVYPFNQAIEAIEYSAQGRAKGKIIIQLED